MGVSITRIVKFIRKGEKGDKGDAGENGITISLLPAALTPKVGVSSTLRVQVALYDGGRLIGYNDETDGNMLCSILPTSSAYKWTFRVESGKFYFVIMLTPTDTTAISLPFTITYKGAKYDSVITIQPVADGQDGARGDRGPALRGPQAWSDCAVGYVFQSGASGEEYKDVVLYGNNYYSCIKSHAKTASNFPGSATDTNSGLWKLADKLEIVATKILLAQYALVKNLGVETIDMKDDKGNIIFQAKDGNVTCNSGTFNNIKVTGNSEFSGTMKAVSGSFKSLNCVDDSGKVVGNIAFGSDGRMWFDGDMYSQGYRSDKERSNRFYASDILCRGMFGHREKITAVVKGSYMYVYSKGGDQSGTYVSLKTGKTSDNKTFYYIPLFSPSDADDLSGLPIDVVVFNTSLDYYYAFSGMNNGKEWRVINGNDKQTVHFCDIVGWHSLGGGASLNCIYVNPEWLNPVPGASDIGRGVFWTGETDLNW